MNLTNEDKNFTLKEENQIRNEIRLDFLNCIVTILRGGEGGGGGFK